MNTPARALLTFGLVALAGVAGYEVGRRQAGDVEPSANSPTADAGATPGETARLREEVARLRSENERRAKTPATPGEPAAAVRALPAAADEHAARMAKLRALAEAQKDKTASINLPIVTRDGKLAPGFAQMFDLTPTETEALQNAVAQGRQQIDGLMAANATVTPSGDTVVVEVKPFAGGGDVYDSLMDAFARTLGPERNELFLALQTDQLTRAFNSFGGEERTLTFSREPGIGGSEPRLVLNDRQKAPRSTSTSTMTYPDLAKLPEQYAWVVPLVPQVSTLPARPRPAPNGPNAFRP